MRLVLQICLRGLTSGIYSRLYTAPALHYRHIGVTFQPPFKLIGTESSEDEMGMRVHKAGKQHIPAGIDTVVFHVGRRGGTSLGRAYIFDYAACDDDTTVVHDRELGHGSPPAGLVAHRSDYPGMLDDNVLIHR